MLSLQSLTLATWSLCPRYITVNSFLKIILLDLANIFLSIILMVLRTLIDVIRASKDPSPCYSLEALLI